MDINKVAGSGPRSRILKQDVLKHLAPSPHQRNDRSLQHKDIPPVQRRVAKRVEENDKVPSVTQQSDIDVTDLEEFRLNVNKELCNFNVHLTILSFVVKAISVSIRKFKLFNSYYDAASNKIVERQYCNIGFVVEALDSIVVPVLFNAFSRGLVSLSQEINKRTTEARAGGLGPLNVKDGCFTISSLGGLGGGFFNPIINMPQAGILGMSQLIIKPVWLGVAFAPRLIMPVSLTYDHRLINGAYAIRFINSVRMLLSDPKYIIL